MHPQAAEVAQIGRFLAGQALSPCSKLYPLTQVKTYRNSLRPIESSWRKHERNHENLSRWWQKRYPQLPNSNVFYPFGGPDISNAILLFPNAKVFTLFGLENIGAMPQINRYMRNIKGTSATQRLRKMQHALRSILRLNFFITMQMFKDFHPYSHITMSEIFLFF